jgi:hypothetical protein
MGSPLSFFYISSLSARRNDTRRSKSAMAIFAVSTTPRSAATFTAGGADLLAGACGALFGLQNETLSFIEVYEADRASPASRLMPTGASNT